MTTSLPFTLHRLPFTVRYPLTVYHGPWFIANGKAYKVVRIKPVRRGGELQLRPFILYTFPFIRRSAARGGA